MDNDELKDIEVNDNAKKKSKSSVYTKVITLLALVLVVVLLFFVRQYEKEKNRETEAVEKLENDARVKELKNTIKDYMENGKGTMNMLRDLYPENVIVAEGSKYLFIPVDENLKKNEIVQENIKKLDSGELQYIEDEKVTSIKGIDVSKFQGDIDWNKVAADGVKYAMIRLGYRGYGSGAIVMDENFQKNIEGALSAGIEVGVYFFSQAVTEDEAVEEAKYVLEAVKPYKITYPIVFDTEEIKDTDTRSDELTTDELTDVTVAFCKTVKDAKYTPMIYANLRWFTMSLDMSKLEDYDKWYAYYDEKMYFPYKISMWQYTENGTVNGINGNVDMNISFKTWK